MKIGERIKQRRNELKMSQRELAEKMGYSNHSTLARIEAGKVDISQTRAAQFAEVLGVSIYWLMDLEEEMYKKNDAITDIVLRLRKDDDFLKLIESLNKLDNDQLSSVVQLLVAFTK